MLVHASFSHYCFFFFNDTATTEIYTLSLHDALPIYSGKYVLPSAEGIPDFPEPNSSPFRRARNAGSAVAGAEAWRSEEHTSELQSRPHLVCRLLLEKKKNAAQFGRDVLSSIRHVDRD